jgi:hypothetical protein
MIYAYFVAISLMDISPLGKFEATMRGLKIHHTPNQLVTDLTAPCQLGGIFAPMLRGPTPEALVARLAPALYAASAIPNPATFDLPVNTRPSGTALQVNSWRE